MDLISCRNLLIYLGAELQKKLVPLFHYALNQEGFLFLGNAETVGEVGDLFSTLDRKWKVYQRKGGVTHAPPSRRLRRRWQTHPVGTVRRVNCRGRWTRARWRKKFCWKTMLSPA
jgi:hypothetical protein